MFLGLGLLILSLDRRLLGNWGSCWLLHVGLALCLCPLLWRHYFWPSALHYLWAWQVLSVLGGQAVLRILVGLHFHLLSHVLVKCAALQCTIT